jgi:predicted transcriptional regulator of viral defense system
VPVDADEPSRWSEDPLVLADAAWAPCFFTGWTSANHWGLTEQVFRTTVLKTAHRVRRSEQLLLDHPYLLVHVNESDFWGLETVWRDERRVRIANQARTVIDVLNDPRLGGGIRHVADIVATYLDDQDGGRLVEYGDKAGNRSVFKRLGYILEQLAIEDSALMNECRNRVSAGMSLLDPSAPASGQRITRWGIRANVALTPRDAS